jgi:molybdopterin molybdotransferase
MTGAPVPADVDVVIRREDIREEKDKVTLLVDSCKPFQNISRQGEDFIKGASIIDQRVICNAAVISLLAAVGKDTVTVERLPKVAIITTGNEIVPVNSEVQPVQIRNSNAWLLRSLLAKQLITPVSVEHIADDKHLLRAAFKKVLDADIIITCGGVSAGDADYVPLVAEESGIKILFHKLSIKPGKPVLCGVTSNGGMLFGLPGNPFSSLVTFMLFIQHYLDACNQLRHTGPIQTQLHGIRTKKSTLDEFFPVKLVKSANAVEPLTFNGSGDIQAAVYADGIGFHPAEKNKIETGDHILWLPL